MAKFFDEENIISTMLKTHVLLMAKSCSWTLAGLSTMSKALSEEFSILEVDILQSVTWSGFKFLMPSEKWYDDHIGNEGTSVFSGFMRLETTLKETDLFVGGTQDLQNVQV